MSLPDGVEPWELPLLEVDDCDPLHGGVQDSFFPREEVRPTLW